MSLVFILRTAEALIVPFAFGFVAAIWLVPVAAWLAHWTGAVAKPNNRTLHQGDIPRLGGVALVASILLGIAGLSWWPSLEQEMWFVHGPSALASIILLAGGGAFLVGLADDLFQQPAITRLVCQIGIGLAVGYLGAVLWVVPSPWGGMPFVLTPLGAKFVTMAWVVLMINATNFMDGMDGHILVASVVQFMAYAALFFTLGGSAYGGSLGALGPFYASLMLLFIGTCLGTLAYNWPKASVFLGDGGSYFLGFLLALVPLWVAQSTVLRTELNDESLYIQMIASPLGMFIIASPILVDVLFTLGRRVLEGHHPFEPHREHLYQRLVMAGLTHAQVLLIVLPFQLWNAILGYWAWCDTSPSRQAAATALCAVSWLYYYLIVRNAEKQHLLDTAAAVVPRAMEGEANR